MSLRLTGCALVGAWYSFNDAVVTELDRAELDMVLGSSTPDPEASESSTNPYMLQYRQVRLDPPSEAQIKASIPQELREVHELASCICG